MPSLMVCENCGGPLPALLAESPFVRCLYCNAVSSVRDGAVSSVPETSYSPSAETLERAIETRRQAMQAFHHALEAAAASTALSYDQFRRLCDEHLAPLGRTDSIARVAYNLALDAEQDLDASLRTRGGALARLTMAYIDAVQELATQRSYRLNLPFLFATPEGPRHYERMLDARTIAALAEREPPSAPEPEPKPGFWKKLFG